MQVASTVYDPHKPINQKEATMTNVEIVDKFVETLLADPECTMTAVALRLSVTDYELRLLKSDPCKMHYETRDAQKEFQFETAEKGGGW